MHAVLTLCLCVEGECGPAYGDLDELNGRERVDVSSVSTTLAAQAHSRPSFATYLDCPGCDDSVRL